MAAAMKSMCMLLVVASALVAMAPGGEGALGCDTVISSLDPCIPYITGRGPLGSCCGGVKGLYAAAKTTADRQAVCGCVKKLAQAFGPNLRKANSLPGKCGVKIPFKISPYTDCSKVV